MTKTYLAKMAGEITEHYDIDGIHLDYIRYPESGENFPDYNEFRKYNRAGKTRAEWRRDNITAIVESIYKEVKSKKRWVKVTCATIGKYKDTRDYSSKGWNSFHVVKQDPVAWLERGIVDIETLKTTNESLISTLDEVMRIQTEGRQKRKEAEVELNRIENELKTKLLSMRA